MDQGTEKLIKDVGLIGAAYFLVVRPILTSIGVDPADTETVKAQNNTSPDENPFSPQFAPFLAFWQANQPAGLSVQDGMMQIASMYDDGTLTPGSEADNTAKWGEQIISALSVWNWVADTQAVLSVFSQMQNQIQVASLAAYLAYAHNKELLTYLHYGGAAIPWIPNGLPESQVAQIINLVNNLPVQ